MRDAENADSDLRKAVSLAPSDVAIRKELQKVSLERKRQNQKQAKTFAGIFDQVNLYDDKDDKDNEEGPKKAKSAKIEPEEASESDVSIASGVNAVTEVADSPEPVGGEAKMVEEFTSGAGASEGGFSDLARPD